MKRTIVVAVLAATTIWGQPTWAQDSEDGRIPIEVSVAQRDFVLAEMRAFLEATQDVLLAVADNDMAGVAEVARTMGPGQGGGLGMGMNRAMPMEFRQMGRATHMAFAELAQSAELGPEGVIADLGNLMSNCTGCHATYRLAVQGTAD